MEALDPQVALALDVLAPPRGHPDHWRAILDEAVPRRRRWLVRGVPVFTLAAAAALLALAWPFGGGPRGSILERAAAAIGNGPVLHVVIQSGWGGTLVDLKTGERTEVHGEEELWYDPQRGIHDVSLFGGVVQGEALYPPGRVGYLDKTLAGLATGYRDALRDGSARVLGPDVVDGRPVYWIRVDTQMLPDAADGKLHAWAHDVAVSQTTFEPVATRETRDGEPGPDGNATVLGVETLPSGEGDFNRATPDRNGRAMKSEPGGPLTLSQAGAALGRPALWAGRSVAGLELSRVARTDVSEGYDPRTRTWADTHTTVTLFYGRLDANERLPGIGIPPPATPFVEISESPTLFFGFQRGASNYSPPEGSIMIFAGRIAVMQADGVHLALEASSEDVLLAAARALEPAPPG